MKKRVKTKKKSDEKKLKGIIEYVILKEWYIEKIENNRNGLSKDRKLIRKSCISRGKVKNFKKKWQVDSRITAKENWETIRQKRREESKIPITIKYTSK